MSGPLLFRLQNGWYKSIGYNYNFVIGAICFINSRRSGLSEIFVTYTDGGRERIWSYNNRYDFDHRDFIGKSKLEAAFYCNRKTDYISVVVRRIYTPCYERKKPKLTFTYGGIAMETQTTTSTITTLDKPRYVIYYGVRMSYEEWLEMKNAD